MKRILSLIRLFLPSFSSWLVTTSVACLMLLVGARHYIVQNSYVRQLLTAYHSIDLIGYVRSGYQEVSRLLASEYAATISIFLFWILVGIAIFRCLQHLKILVVEEVDVRAFYRTGIVLAGAVYWICFTEYVLPILLRFFKRGIIAVDWSSLAYILMSIFGAAAAVHVYVILARLFVRTFPRPRYVLVT